MIKEFWNFINTKFDSMPKSVRIITFLIILFCFTVQLLTPKYIDIRLVGTVNNDEFPIAEARVEIETEDRVITMISNSRGRFSVPIGLANPLTSFTFILYPDSKTRRQLDIEVGGHKAYSAWNKLTYHKSKDAYEFTNNFSFPFLAKAYAESSSKYFQTIDEIDDVIITSIAKSKRINPNNISLKSNLRTDLEIGNYEMSYISYKLNEKFGIQAWDGIWNSARTPEDIIKIARTVYYQDKVWGSHLKTRIVNLSYLMNNAKDTYSQELFNNFKTARVLRKTGKTAEAVIKLNEVLSNEPEFYLAQYNIALAYSEIKDIEKTITAYEKAIKLQENQGFSDASLYNSYGRFLYQEGKYRESLKQYIKVLALAPDREFLQEYINDSLSKLNCGSLKECISEAQKSP